MNKIVVSKKVADYLNNYKEELGGADDWKDLLLFEHTQVYEEVQHDRLSKYPLKKYSPMKLAELLLKDYEVEDSPQTIVTKAYEQLVPDAPMYMAGVKEGIKIALEAYGIHIPGISKVSNPVKED